MVLFSFASVKHAPLLQQPEHDPPLQLHTPFEQALPELHALHAAPPVPHCELDSLPYGTHVLPLQQPFGHELALHTHWPLPPQACPLAQPAQLAPAVPHDDADSEE